MIRKMATFLLAISLTAVASVNLVAACNGNYDTERAAETVLTGPVTWFRCLEFTTETVYCQAKDCNGQDTKLKYAEGFKTLDECESTAVYQQCYSFSKDGSSFGKCQPDWYSCPGPDSVIIAIKENDRRCGFGGPFTLGSRPTYVRCISKYNGIKAVCRPSAAGCAPYEENSPFGKNFETDFECSAFRVSTYIRCVSQNSATCRLYAEGCASHELQMPATETYPHIGLCNDRNPAPLYDLCYDFDAAPATTPVCQFIETGCSGPRQRRIYGSINDYTCKGFALPGGKLPFVYLRCVRGAAIACRPEPIGCIDGELQTPMAQTFRTYTECATFNVPNVLCGPTANSQNSVIGHIPCSCEVDVYSCAQRASLDLSITTSTTCRSICTGVIPTLFTTCIIETRGFKICSCILLETCNSLMYLPDFNVRTNGSYTDVYSCEKAC